MSHARRGRAGACVAGILCLLALSASQIRAENNDAPAAAKANVRDIYGVEHRLAEFLAPPAEGVVLIFCQPGCPVVNQYLPRLRELQREYNAVKTDRTGTPVRTASDGRIESYTYAGDKVLFLAVYSSPDLSIREMAAHALEARIPFRALADAKQELARAVGATRYGEVVLLDPSGKVRYRGMVDDQFFAGGAKPAPTEHYLHDAIDAVRAGKEIAVPERPGRGCLMPQREAEAPATKLTFHRDVEPILQQHCQSCHRAGMVGPMPLTTYAEVKDFAPMIDEVVADLRMPPWPADSSRKFKDDRRLSERDRETLREWIAGGMPKGDAKDAPPARSWPAAKEWSIGKPDLVFEMPEPFQVPESGVVDYVYYPIKMNLPKDRYIEAIEVAAGSPSVVHHIQVLELQGKMPEGNGARLTPVQQAFLYGPTVGGLRLVSEYSPGGNENFRIFPAGQAMKLAAGSNLLFELHYTPTGRATSDRSKVGIKFTDYPPEREIHTKFFRRKRGDFVIPANATQHTMQHLYHWDTPVRILAVRPHMHVRARSFRLDLVKSADVNPADIQDFASHDTPRGETVLTVPMWDFNWQLTYHFDEPIVLRKGEAFLATGYWDNSRFNPRNPNWREDVPWGLQSQQEMFNTMFLYEELKEDDPSLRE